MSESWLETRRARPADLYFVDHHELGSDGKVVCVGVDIWARGHSQKVGEIRCADQAVINRLCFAYVFAYNQLGEKEFMETGGEPAKEEHKG